MRDIKFRVWDKERGRFHFGCSNVCLTLSGRLMWQFGFKSPDLLDNEESTQFTICQYTGLKDSKGVEIYEGDIVTAGDNHPSLVQWDNREARFELFEKYPRRGRYADKFDRYHEMTAYTDGLGEVIGNIYEHGDLLK